MKTNNLISLLLFLMFTGMTYLSSAQCTYSICLEDTYGDGWNGGSVSVNVGGVNVVSGATLSADYGPACYNFTVSQGQSITVNYTGGSWTSENYYTVYNSSNGGGTVLYASSYGSTPPTSQAITNGCTSGGGGTPTSCTHSICLYDTWGDGWNGGSLNVSVAGSTVVSGATISSGSGPTCYNFTANSGDAITVSYTAGSYSSENYYVVTNSSGGSGTSLYNSGSGYTPPSTQNIIANCSGGSPAPGDCLNALPFCTSNSYTFPASVNVPNMGPVGCLGSTPNPAWYWMEIGAPGNIDIYMSSGGDVDFIAWGPFTTLPAACASGLMSNSGVDCSYSMAAQETANLTNTQTGEVYVLLITNYANIVTNISFSQTSGAGSTNCGIIAPPITNNGPLCVGQTLHLMVSNPTAGATYLWSGPDGFSSTTMNPSISNVTAANAGTYSLVITVGASTSPPVTTTVVINPNVTPTFTAGGTYCSGASVPAFPTTSTNGITGSWSPAISNTATTTYTFTPTAGQCATTATNTITITPNTTPTFNAVGPYCSGSSIPALPTTSTNGITGTWSPAINNTATTNYTFTPTAGQCATSASLQISITSLTTPTFTAVGSFCSGASISALPTTSNNGITGSWSPAINNTATTTYTFTPNAGQCASTTTMTITINPNINPSFTQLGPYCSGASISNLPATSTNGITGLWSPAINNMATTTYTFTPTAGLCALPTNMTIVVNTNVEPSFSGFGPYCAGTVVPVLPTTSLNGFTGTWSPPISNTQTTTYTFTPTAGQCATTTTTEIVIDSLESTILFVTNQFCDAKGSAGVTGIGGTPSYSYLWPSNAAGVSGGNATQLNSGNYNVTISDTHGCSTVQPLTIGFTNNMILTNTGNVDPACFGDSNGSAVVNVQHGASPYFVNWGIGSTVSNLSAVNVNGLAQGDYIVTVTDQTGCTAETSFSLDQPTLLVANASFTQMLCSGDNSVVTVSASGGTPNYTGCGNFTVSSGLYYYTVTDNNDCQASCSVNVPSAPAQLSVNSYTTDVSCFGEDDGAINIVTTGGTQPYTYLWSGSMSGANIIGLSPGDYDVVIRDYNGCSISRSFYISEPEQIDFNFVTENILCFGANTGKVEMSASGGYPPYSFAVYNPYFTANGPTHPNLAAGDYSVKVTDANGCSVAGNIMILSPSQLQLSYAAVSPSCIGNNDGSVEIIASGGTSPYLYTFDQMLFDIPFIGSLKEGVYNLSVLDANNCSREIKSISLTDIQVDCIRIPNAFTPNGDDINDTWQIDHIDKFPDAVIQVYNRWGQAVYYARPEEADWDGIYNGKIVPAGAYVYVINLFNGKEPYTGVVSVVH